MDLNQIKASKLVQMSSFFSKQDENMVYSYNMDMHVTIYHEFNSKLINSTMHARNELQSIIYGPNHDLALQLDMNHAWINLNTSQKDEIHT